MSAAHSLPHFSLCNDFKAMLETTWSRSATSGKYKDTSKIIEWMKRIEVRQKGSNAERLLREVFERSQARTFPPIIESNTGDHCYLLLSILVEINHAELIDFFRELKITDSKLDIAHFHYDWLRKDLTNAHTSDATAIIDRFEAARWSYLPPKFDVGFDERFHGGKWILPFCKREPITEKGGTARLWQVAIQEDHVQQDLRRSIERSKFKDEKFGWCYCLAVKSYPEEFADIFRLEKEAFQGLGPQKGMVQYLGCYSIDGCPLQSGSHNILLEYGQFDLDEYFADKRSYPPIRGAEIRLFWQSLFEIADAIRRIHNLEHKDKNGGTDEYNGWHADIKPDNILRIDGEFKLADFGFAKFQKRDSDEVPKSFIEGGTETYGPPERDSASFKHGERKTFSQTIDIWSFGCVLSISATWVVLGIQGVLQYGALREKAIRELKSRRARRDLVSIPTADDSFHDGKTVLPAIFHWHDYLRTNKRQSDKVTERLLDLVDAHMLQEDPNKRHTSVKLCAKLDEILQIAELDENSAISKGQIPIMHKDVKEALLEHEKGAFSDLVQAGKGVNDNKQSPMMANGTSPAGLAIPEDRRPSSSKRAGSKRIGKFEKITEVPRGKTANRAQILEQELDLTSDNSQASQTLNPFALTDLHMTESPIEEQSPNLGAFRGNVADVEKLQMLPERSSESNPALPTVYNDALFQSSMIPQRPTAGHGYSDPNHGSYQSQEAVHRANFGNPVINVRAATVDNYQPVDSSHDRAPDFNPGSIRNRAYENSPKNLNRQTSPVYTMSGHSALQERSLGESSDTPTNGPYDHASIEPNHDYSRHLPTIPTTQGYPSPSVVSNISMSRVNTVPVSISPSAPSPNFSNYPTLPTAASPVTLTRNSMTTPPLRTSPLPLSASRTVSIPGGSSSKEAHADEGLPEVSSPKRVNTSRSGKTSVVETHDSYWPPGQVPRFVLQLDIYKTRQKLDRNWPSGVKLKLASYTRSYKKDSRLGHYIQDRDIMFLVDNGSSMSPHWEAAKFVLETLAMKLAGIDKDGLDLYFTFGAINVQNAAGLTAPKKFVDSMDLASPNHPDRGDQPFETDMSANLGPIFDKYNPAKRMTLIVLTDGVWAKRGGVERMIAGFIKNLSAKRQAELRRFSIEFVRFGTDDAAKARLKWLDDKLHTEYDVEDIIDTVDWTGNVEKMILGSSHDIHDHDSDDEAIIEELAMDGSFNGRRQSVDQKHYTSDRRSAIGRSGTVQSKSSRASQKFSQFWRGASP